MGIPITLSVIYLCVAKRCGLECVPINFSGYFLLQVPAEGMYVDASRQGRRMDRREAMSMAPMAVVGARGGIEDQSFPVAKPIQASLIIFSRFLCIYVNLDSINTCIVSFYLLTCRSTYMYISTQVFQYMCREFLATASRQRDLWAAYSFYHDDPDKDVSDVRGLREAFEMSHLIGPDALQADMGLVQIFLESGINLGRTMELLEDVKRQAEARSAPDPVPVHWNSMINRCRRVCQVIEFQLWHSSVSQ